MVMHLVGLEADGALSRDEVVDLYGRAHIPATFSAVPTTR